MLFDRQAAAMETEIGWQYKQTGWTASYLYSQFQVEIVVYGISPILSGG